jgi:N-acetylglucosamine-6-sulfatase
VPGTDYSWVLYGDPQYYRGFDYDADMNGKRQHYGKAAKDYSTDVMAGQAASFVRHAPADKPVFLDLSPVTTHRPWVPAPRDDGIFKAVRMPQYPNQNEADTSGKPAYIRALGLGNLGLAAKNRRREWESARGVDDLIRQVDDALRDTDRQKNTLLIVTTDQGYSFLAHRWVTKRCEYTECARTPLYIRWPGHVVEGTHNEVLSNVDLAPTLVAAAHARPFRQFDGRSVLPVVTGASQSWPYPVLGHWPGGNESGIIGTKQDVPPFWSLRTNRYRYVELGTGERELYDLAVDPYELQNLANRPTVRVTQDGLARQLRALIPKGNGKPVPSASESAASSLDD